MIEQLIILTVLNCFGGLFWSSRNFFDRKKLEKQFLTLKFSISNSKINKKKLSHLDESKLFKAFG
jgi:hypothetical protein